MCDLSRKQEANVILQSLEQELDSAGIAGAKMDARCLLGIALGRDVPVLPHEDIFPLDVSDKNCLEALLQRRLAGEPISRIRGWREFWSLRFAISQATLDPRSDSETVVEAAIKWANRKSLHAAPLRCLDLGTGSGCLLVALLTELPQATGIGIDFDLSAVRMAAANATRHGLSERTHFYQHSFFDDLACFGSFDIILSNPPYIPTGEIAGLAVEVKAYDPAMALDGGCDGMACWRKLLPRLSGPLNHDGAVFVEIGRGQKAAVKRLAGDANLLLINSYRDISGVTRCLHFEIKI